MLSDGVIKKVIPNNPVLLEHFKNNHDMTNKVFFGNHVNTAIGFATSGAMARTMGTVSPLQVLINLAKRGTLGIANMSAAGTVASAAVNSAVNGIVVGAALEGGILIGSGINALIQTYIQQEQ